MKRKRGHKKKKGESKKLPLQSAAIETAENASNNDDGDDIESVNDSGEENSGSEEEEEEENDGVEEEGEEESKSISVPIPVVIPERRENVAVNVRPTPTAVYGRVRVKLKTTAKPPLEIQSCGGGSSEGKIVSDGGKSGEVVGVGEKKEGGEVVVVVGGGGKVEDGSKKSRGIKIVSSKNSSPDGGNESGGGGSGGGSGSGLSPEDKKVEEKKTEEEMEEQEVVLPRRDVEYNKQELKEQEVALPRRDVKYNKQELEGSLEVIKKVMKMDAAEPFNVPVDPIKLGIPDYFDVIDTPMDLGTIRSNLENGTKYMDSEDVYKDVQYIWDNCYKYNNKGDYIVDLMKRVKKNFMKYWMAAALYTEQNKKIIGGESTPPDEPATSGHGKKLKKGKGFKRHKDDCLCAICTMKRRRREREAREAQLALEAGVQTVTPHIKHSKTGLLEEYKQEEISHTESPVEDTSSYMETSPDGDADAEMEDGEVRPDAVAPQYTIERRSEIDRIEFRDKSDRSRDISEKSVQSDKVDTELYTHTEAKVHDESGNRIKIDAQKQPEAQTPGFLQQRLELLELEKRRQKQRMLETFRDLENPMILGLCGMLFPNNVRSVWNGANSLVTCQRSCHRSDIHEAVASFMNPPCKSASSLK